MVNTDVRSPGGWIQLYGVRISKALAVGTVLLAAVLNIHGAVNFQTVPGTSTGAVIQVDGLTREQTFPTTCHASGGLTGIYSACDVVYPYNTSGSLLNTFIEAGNMAVSLVGDVSIKRASIAATGTVLTNLDGVTVGSGTQAASVFAVPVNLRKGDHITFSTRTTPTGSLSTTRYDFQMWITILDRYGR